MAYYCSKDGIQTFNVAFKILHEWMPPALQLVFFLSHSFHTEIFRSLKMAFSLTSAQTSMYTVYSARNTFPFHMANF